MNDRLEYLRSWLNSGCDTRYPECIIERIEEGWKLQEEFLDSLGLDDEMDCLKELLENLLLKEIGKISYEGVILREKLEKYCDWSKK